MKKKNKTNYVASGKAGAIPVKTLVMDDDGYLHYKTKLFLGDKVEYMKCELCGGKMKKDEMTIFTGNPPKEIYVCEKCHHNQYVNIGYYNPNYQTGWVCPKCGSVMSPYQSTCPNCTPPQKLQIWC